MKTIRILNTILISLFLLLIQCEQEPVNQLPLCSILSPEDGAEFSLGQVIPIQVDASDEDGSVTGVIIYINEEKKIAFNSPPYNYDWDTQDVAGGFYTIKARVFDDAAGSAEAISGVLLSYSPPVVEIMDIHSIEENSVLCDGEVISDGGLEVTQRGICWGLNTNPTLDDQSTNDGGGTGSFTSMITGLVTGTVYYFRAYAINDIGIAYGEETSFTFIGKPVVEILDPFSTTNLTATCRLEIVSDGGADIVDKGIIWNEASKGFPDSSFSEHFISLGARPENHGYLLRGLDPDTDYSVWAYAINQVGISYSEPAMLRTLPVEKDILVDQRDGTEYKIVKLMGQWWMAENMNIGEMISSSVNQTDNSVIEKYCYNNNDLKCADFGGLYQLNEMMQYQPFDEKPVGTTRGICPVGWHIPTDKEWQALEYSLGMDSSDLDKFDERYAHTGLLREAGTENWFPPNINASNSTGFTILPGGLWYFKGWFGDMGLNAYFWTASSWYRRIYHDSEYIGRYGHDPHCAMSVRCVKNK
jgi:uncharacterized protein (TIGR02145 family)